MTNKIKLKPLLAFLVIFCLGTAISLFLRNKTYNIEKTLTQNKFTEEALKLTSAIQLRLTKAESLLYGMRGLFESSDFVSPNEWDRFVLSVDLPNRFPSIRSLFFVNSVSKADLDQFVKKMREYGYSEFKIWPVDGQSTLFPVTYISNQSFADFQGYDLATNPEYKEILAKPMNLYETFSSSDFTRKDTKGHKTSFTFWLLLPKKIQNLQTSAPVLGSGWLALSIDLSIGIEAEMSLQKISQMNLQLFNNQKISSENLLYSRVITPDPNPLFSNQSTINLGTKKWTLLFTSGPNYQTKISKSFANIIFSLSILFSTLLATAVAYAYTAKQRIETKIDDTVQELKRAYSYYQQLLNCVRYSIIAVDAQGIIQTFNRAAEKLLGYSSDELIGKKSPLEFHDPSEVEAYAKELSELFGIPISSGMTVFFMKAKQGSADERKWTYICKNKTRVEVILSITALKNENGDLIGYIGVAIPIEK